MPIMNPQAIDSLILKRIYRFGRGSVFSASDFVDLADKATSDRVLSRLAGRKTIRRLARGLYDYPNSHPVLGVLTPAVDVIAEAIAGRDKARLQPSGAYAANLLGLSEQVPAKVTFLTDGTSRTVRIGPMEIQLRRTTPRNMAAARRISGLLIQALRHLGQRHVTPQHVAHLKRTIPAEQRRSLLKDLRLAPAWMHPRGETGTHRVFLTNCVPVSRPF